MGLLYEPREKDEQVFIRREVEAKPDKSGSTWVMLVDARGRDVNAACVEIGPDGIRRFFNRETKHLDCAHDPDGRIALHPDDPAMKRIAELEARVKELEAAPTVAPELTAAEVERMAEQAFNASRATGFRFWRELDTVERALALRFARAIVEAMR